MLLTNSNALQSALLYLDPGTGSLLFSVIVGIASTAYFVVRDLIYRVRTHLHMMLSPAAVARTRTVQHAVVFYSEGSQYRSTFAPLLDGMQGRGLPCLYLSSDASDPLLELGRSGMSSVQTECIGEGHLAWGRLRTLRAKVVCMTTPGLDVMQIRRSPHVEHYMHLVHSPTDKSFNRPYSFDFFDSVVINGPHQARVIRHLEQLRSRKTKDLYQLGCIYYDSLLPAYQAAVTLRDASQGASETRVLLAPTWGKNGLLSRYGSALIRAMVDVGLNVTLRPHPQSRKSEAELLSALQRDTSGMVACYWDFSADPIAAMANSDILLSDISGIVFDYAFLTGRPVLTMDFTVDKRGFEAMDLPFEPWEIACLDVIGRRIGMADIGNLQAIVLEECQSTTRAEQIARLRGEFVCNFGRASAPVVERIAQLLEPGAQTSKAVTSVTAL
ncbi:MAG: CDP-glycerol glycerophosphotransferase family protein [Ramlibacter sp.]|nr:CDP-glycerol glycerophosphotransferase family protein [Ramlibacter sp.]